MNLFNFLLNRGTSLQYVVRENNIGAIDTIIKSLTRAGWKCVIINNTLFLKHEKKISLNEILLTGSLIGMIELGEKVK